MPGVRRVSEAVAVHWTGRLTVDPREWAAAKRAGRLEGWLEGFRGWKPQVVAPGVVLLGPRKNLVVNTGIGLSADRTFGLTDVTPASAVVNAIGVDNGTADPVPNTNMSAQLNVAGCTLTSGSTSVTTTDTADLAGVAAGMGVSGTGVASGTTVASVDASAGTLTLSAAATASGTETLTFATSTARTILTMSPAASRTGSQVSAGATFTNANVSFVMQRLFLNVSTTDAAGNLYAMTNVFTINMTGFSSWSQSFTPTITFTGS